MTTAATGTTTDTIATTTTANGAVTDTTAEASPLP